MNADEWVGVGLIATGAVATLFILLSIALAAITDMRGKP